MNYKLKLKSKFLWYDVLGILTLSLILFISYLFNRLIETSITIIFFFIYRSMFDKQYHASNLYECSFISIIVFTVIIQLEVSLSISILFCIIVTFIITLISYYVKEFIDNKYLLEKYKLKLNTLNTKCLENLTEEEMIQLFPRVKYSIIKLVYGYLHRKTGMTAQEYAYRNDISAISIYKYVKKMRDDYEDLIKY